MTAFLYYQHICRYACDDLDAIVMGVYFLHIFFDKMPYVGLFEGLGIFF